ncbi:MAG TPA: cation:proton antiporter [Xanthobacteraceae bacterium]|nr:cation:proton antiporter [Xanthobacteraceae bacterium]
MLRRDGGVVESAPWLNDVCVFLGVAGMIVPLFQRARISAVLGFILAGIAIGPFGLGRLAAAYPWVRYLTIEDRSAIEPFGELGVMFLLFLIGIELSLPRLWSMRRYVLGVGAVQVGASMVAIGGVLLLLGLGAEAAVVLAMALALSSTAIVMQLLQEQGRAATTLGRVALSVLLFQDLMVSPVLFVTGVLGRSEGNVALGFAIALAQAAAAVALIVVAGRYVLRPLLRFAGRTGSRDLIMAITILIVLTIAAATAAAGLSVALGAFLAGLLLGESEFGEQIEVDLEPFKGLLLGLFFTTVGMSINLADVAQSVHWLVLASAGLLLLKALVLFAAARAFGVAISTSAEVALLLPQASEFAFVVVGLAGASALLEPRVASFTLACVSLTMLATPPLALAGRRAGILLQRMGHGDGPSDAEIRDLEGHVVIGGFGRVGQIIASLLEAEKIPFVALDTDGALVTRERKAGRLVFFGDAARPEMLERAGVARAGAVVVTLDAPRAAERMVEHARKHNPSAVVVARATDRTHAARLLARGALGVIPEAVEASLQLAGRLLEALDLPKEAVQRRLAQAREAERERLVEAAEKRK